MPRPANTSRFVISGSLPGSESFAWGFWTDGAATSQTPAQDAANAVRDYFSNYAQTFCCGVLAPDSAYLKVTYYGYALGTGPANTQAEAVISTGAGTGIEAQHPTQVGWVVSTHTPRAGRRGRGRLYIPVNSLDLTAHQAVAGDTDNLLNAFKAFFDAVNGSVVVPGNVAVVSQMDALAHPVSSISADSRLDIQRRRAASEPATYKSSLVLS